MFHPIKAPLRQPLVTVIAVVKNEYFFLPAFLDHYRSLGAKQFIFLDDRSTDRTHDYLMAQSDCAVLASDLSYGNFVDGKKADVHWRSAIPRAYCQGRWGLVVDADEFLELPPGFADLETFAKFLEQRGHDAVGAVMVDFYPDKARDLNQTETPASLQDLLARYPFFDDRRYGHWIPGRNRFQCVYGGVRDRLMRQHNIPMRTRDQQSLLRVVRKHLRKLAGIEKKTFFCAIHKVPLVRWSDDCAYLSSHNCTKIPAAGIQLPLIHFKFTGSLLSKIDSAISSAAYHKKSADYISYRNLLTTMIDGDLSFLGEHSRRYTAKSDFIANQLLKFDVAEPPPTHASLRPHRSTELSRPAKVENGKTHDWLQVELQQRAT